MQAQAAAAAALQLVGHRQERLPPQTGIGGFATLRGSARLDFLPTPSASAAAPPTDWRHAGTTFEVRRADAPSDR